MLDDSDDDKKINFRVQSHNLAVISAIQCEKNLSNSKITLVESSCLNLERNTSLHRNKHSSESVPIAIKGLLYF